MSELDTDCSKAHPSAPHGFNRHASINEDRYVCDCEGWEPTDMKYAGLEIVAWLSPTRRTAVVSEGPYAPGWEPLVRLNDAGALIRELTSSPMKSGADECALSVRPGTFLAEAVAEVMRKRSMPE